MDIEATRTNDEWIVRSVDVKSSLLGLKVGDVREGECKDFAKASTIRTSAARMNKKNEKAGRKAAVRVEITANDTHYKVEKLAESVEEEGDGEKAA